MAFIKTVAPGDATGKLKQLYDEDLGKHGFVPNYSRAFSLRPEVLAAWRQLLTAVRSTIEPRRYELATVVAAARLRCTY